MSRARELAKAGGVQQRIAGFSSHVGMSTFLAEVHMEDNLTVDGNIGVGGNLTVTGTTTFNGGTLNLGNAATDNVVFGGEVDSNIIPDDDGSFDLGSSSKEWKDLFIDGTAHIDTLDVDENAGIIGNLTVTGNSVMNGNVDLGNATGDTITATGRFDSDLVPSTDGARDLGGASLEWKDLYVDGVAYLDSVESDGGSFGNIQIAETGDNEIDTESGNLTLDSAGGTVAIDDNLTVSGNGTVTGTIDINSSKMTVGTGNTDVIVRGDMRVTGIMSVGNGTVTIDETTVKTGTSNLHSVGVEIAGINVLGADTPIGTGSTIFDNGNALFTGTVTANAAVISTSVSLATLSASGAVDFNGDLDVDGTTDLDTTNVVGTLTVTGDVAADNVTLNGNTLSTSSGDLTIDSAGGTTTIADNAVISGNLTVNGTTTTINSTTVAIDDKNFQVATGAADDAAANGAGFTIDSGDGDKTFNFEATGDNWGASENLNLASGKVYKINNTSVLSATTLGSAVVSSSLTSVGTLGSLAVTNNITVGGTVDGRDVAGDGSKLDGIESGATADQTAAEIRTLVESASDSNVFTDADHSKLNGIEASATADQTASEILTLIKTVDGAGSGLDADTLDGISSASFLRSDTSDTFTGTLTVSGNILPNANGTRDLGATGTRWANIYSSDLDLSNQAKGANSVDGTWGSYLIEEGEDHLFLTNRRSGKKYRFVLEEV
mgnify:CR=1 FL=1